MSVVMPWFKLPEFVKKRACRYLLQHYLGHFFKEKLGIDQLTLDISNGTGKITNVQLDTQVSNIDTDHTYRYVIDSHKFISWLFQDIYITSELRALLFALGPLALV